MKLSGDDPLDLRPRSLKSDAEVIWLLAEENVELRAQIKRLEQLVVEHHAVREMVVGDRCPLCAKYQEENERSGQ